MRSSGLRIQCCHCSSLGCCCGIGLIPDLVTFTCQGYSQKIKEEMDLGIVSLSPSSGYQETLRDSKRHLGEKLNLQHQSTGFPGMCSSLSSPICGCVPTLGGLRPALHPEGAATPFSLRAFFSDSVPMF